jgi:predicted oxidoreductase
MKTLRIPHADDLQVSRIGCGCMHLSRAWDDTAITAAEISTTLKLVETALEQGVTLFDHADIYARGKSEQLFGEALRQIPELRGRIVLQSKCGIRVAGDPGAHSPARYDFSRGHIVRSVEGTLKRLDTDHLDVLLLHRPDPLMDPAEVARAFDQLQSSGKVLHFGVSNHNAAQISLLQEHLEQPLVVNQVELSLLHHQLISDGLLFNQPGETGVGRTLDYCREYGILVQAWSPLAGGRLFADAPGKELRPAAELVAQLAEAKQVAAEAILLAWLLKHPAGIQPILGTTNPVRFIASCQADAIELDREEWYALLAAVRGVGVP